MIWLKATFLAGMAVLCILAFFWFTVIHPEILMSVGLVALGSCVLALLACLAAAIKMAIE